MLEAAPQRKPQRPIYLDYQATTPVDPKVLEAMLPYFSEHFGNPHATTHLYGWEAEEAIELAREQVASLINASEKEIIFTSGATESNNLAIKGAARFLAKKKKHIITVATEHKCVLESCKDLRHEGFEVTVLPVQTNGLLDLTLLADNIREDTALVSIMAVNNEIGVIQPLAEIGALCNERGVLFHTDAAQAFGKIPLDVEAMQIDMLSISGHKIYAPKGIGALYIRRRPRVRLVPLFSGGGQERGLRSGTLPTPLVVGLGKAAVIAQEHRQEDTARIQKLTDKLYAGIQKIEGTVLHGDKKQRIAGNLNIGFDGIDGGVLLSSLYDIAISSGSACTAASLEPSYVLQALGVDEKLAGASFRFGIGRFTTEGEIDLAIDILAKNVEKIRSKK